MSPETPTVLLESVAEALQTMAFVMVDPAPADLATPDRGSLYAVAFEGEPAGEVQIAAPRALGELLAANMLALDPGSTEAVERADDILKELCNITAGLFLRRLGPAEPPEMALPSARDLDPAAWRSFAASATCLLADGLPVAISLKERP